MVVEKLFAHGTEILKKSNSATPQLDAAVLLCYVLNCSRVQLIINKNKEVSQSDEESFIKLVYKRKNDMPIAYITNRQEFMSLDFYVDENVLIPRPDTETLVETIINSKIKKDKILDMCCGSGCIGISLAHYIKNAEVHMADISDKALKIAKKNAENILSSQNVKFYKIDILNEIPNEKYDIIVSNPPYITSEEMKSLEKNVIDYEPEIALYGGEDGLEFYRRIACVSKYILNDGGVLAFEIGESQGEAVKKIMTENGFKNINIINDLAGKNRVVEGRM